MSDANSSLPIRTENNGDAAVKVVDGTTPSQALSVDSSGRVTAKLNDGTGNSVTSQANGAQRALDVGIDVAGVQIDPRQVRALTSADVVTANQGSANTAANGWPVKPTDGTNSQAFLATGEGKVSVTQPLPTGTNVIGSVNQGTSPWISKDQSDGPVTPGTVASFSQLAGAQYNSSAPTLTTGQQAALQIDSSGKLLTNASISNLPTTVDTNYGSTSSSTLRTASQIGNSTGGADFNNGATSAQTLRVAANLSVAGANVSSTNPIPVAITADLTGVETNDYNTASAVAAAATSQHNYTVTAGKTLLLTQVEASGSGKMKIEIQVESGAATNVFATKFVQFNSTSETNMSIHMASPISVVAGARVRIIRTNRDLLSQDLYSTICGQEV